MNLTRYALSGREITIVTTTSGRHDVGIYGAAVTVPSTSPPPDGHSWRSKSQERAVTSRVCLHVLRGASLEEVRTFLGAHGLSLPVEVEDLLWHQEVRTLARHDSEHDPLATLTDWGDQTER